MLFQDFLYAPHHLDGFTSSVHGSRPQDKDLQDGVGMTIPTLLRTTQRVCSQGIVHLLLCRDPFCMVSFLVQS